MNMRCTCVLAVSVMVALGCEGPRRASTPSRTGPRASVSRTTQPEKPAAPQASKGTPTEPTQQSATQAQEPAPPAARPAAPAPTSEIFAPNPVIDGRRVTPPLPGAPASLLRFRTYSFGEIPAPFAPANAVIRIEPDTSPEELPSVRSGTTLRSVVLKQPATAWEGALIRHGIEVLDRDSLPWIEREFFLQEARMPLSAIAKREEFRGTMVGRDNHQILPGHDPLWMLTVDGIAPLISARSVSPEWKLAVGKHHAAQALLEIEEFASRTGIMVQEVDQPTAPSIDHAPRTLGTVLQGEPTPFAWEADAADRFHLTAKGGPVFFDPDKRALWTLSEAWVGHEVTRADYISRRTTMSHTHCPGCARVLEDKTQKQQPSDTETPERWKCPSCETTRPTRYLDGYRAANQANATVSLVLGTRWMQPRPGTYHVLAAEAAIRNVLAASATWKRFEPGELVSATEPARMGLGPAHDWCHLDEEQLATLYPTVEVGKLKAALDKGDLGHNQLIVPAMTQDGRQEFMLTSEPTSRKRFSVPLEYVQVSLRAIGVEDARILCAGTLRLNYRNLLGSGIEIAVTAEGLDLSRWPGQEQQREALRQEAFRRIPPMLKP